MPPDPDLPGEGPYLVAGLGNPGSGYAATRHNLGFAVADELAHREGGSFRNHKSRAQVCSVKIVGRQVVVMKPLTFMNLSGGPVAGVRSYFSVRCEDIIVVHDDLDLPFGTLRLKRGGGEGGHNGLRSVSQSLQTKDYVRVRIGIGRPPGRGDPADYVLKPFSPTERKGLPVLVAEAADAVESIVTTGLSTAQNVIN